MPPKKLGTDYKTIRIKCQRGHEVARYRKPKSEWGERTHKLWLVPERLGRLSTQPPILIENIKTGAEELDIPKTDTLVQCGDPSCSLKIGSIAMVGGSVALKLEESNLMPTKG